MFFFKQKTAYEMRISDWSSDGALPISDGFIRPASSNSSYALATDDWFGMVNIRIQRPSTRSVLIVLKLCEPAQTCITANVRPSSEERRVGQECVSTCRYRWSSTHTKKQHKYYNPRKYSLSLQLI